MPGKLPGLLQAGPNADLSRLPVSLNLRALSIAEGVRAALAVAALVALNEWAAIPALNEAALGALLTCLCDAGGPVRRRVPPLLAFAAVGALLTISFGLLRPFGLWVVVPSACAVIFCASYARIWGQAVLQVGNLLTVVSVLALDRPEDTHEALLLGGMFMGGSLWAFLLTIVIWRLHPYRPARQAVAEVFRRLGVLAGDLSVLVTGGASLPRAWADHARAHRRHVRDGIEQARTLLLDTVRMRGQGVARSNRNLIQVEAADQLFGAMIALSDVLETGDAAAREAAARELPLLRLLLAAIGDATVANLPVEDPERRAMTERLLNTLSEMGAAAPALAGVTDAIVARLRIAALLTTPDGMLPEQGGSGARARWRDRVLAPLRANLDWASPALRHAVRTAVAAAPALAVTLWSGQAYAHWFTITLVLTLQPFFALTWQKALERIGGTVLGGLLAAGLALLVQTPLQTAAALFPLAVLAFSVRAVSFGLVMACMTPLVVLLSEFGRPGESEWMIAAMRAGYTALGGLLAVVGSVMLWPSWEPDRVRRELRAAILAHGAYADQEVAALLGQAPPLALEAARREAGLASNRLEDSLARALQEPRRQARAGLETAMLVDAALRRLAGRLSTLQHDPAQAPADPAVLEAWRTWLQQAFRALPDGADLPPAPHVPTASALLGRVARQVELMQMALRGNPGAL